MLAHPSAGGDGRQGRIATEAVVRYLLSLMNTSIAPLWLSDPAWLAMDATSRGFHAQLILVAARRKPAGALPDDDTQIRKWLGLPTKSPAQGKNRKSLAKLPEGALATFLSGALNAPGMVEMGDDPDRLSLFLWEHYWKPAVMSAWQKIDADLIDEHPNLEKQAGGWYNAIAHAISNGGASTESAKPAPARKAKRSKSKEITLSWGSQLDITSEPANQGLVHGGFSLAALMDSKEVLSRWFPEAEEASRKSMWEIGVDCLAGANASPNEKQKARGLLGKHIKQYGEGPVAKAVATLAMRSMAPVDAASFLAGILRNEVEGSSAERAAREKRATVCL